MRILLLIAISAIVATSSAFIEETVAEVEQAEAQEVRLPYLNQTVEEAEAIEEFVNAPEYLGEWTITFYCPCEECCGVSTGITASEAEAIPWHTVATDQFEFGTRIYIDGLGDFVVEDRGVEGAWIDVFVSDHQEALELGQQTRGVFVYGD